MWTDRLVTAHTLSQPSRLQPNIRTYIRKTRGHSSALCMRGTSIRKETDLNLFIIFVYVQSCTYSVLHNFQLTPSCPRGTG